MKGWMTTRGIQTLGWIILSFKAAIKGETALVVTVAGTLALVSLLNLHRLLYSVGTCFGECCCWLYDKCQSLMSRSSENAQNTLPVHNLSVNHYIWKYYPRNLVQLVLCFGSFYAVTVGSTGTRLFIDILWLNVCDQFIMLVMIKGFNPLLWLEPLMRFGVPFRHPCLNPSMHDRVGTIGYLRRGSRKAVEEIAEMYGYTAEVVEILQEGWDPFTWYSKRVSHEDADDVPIDVTLIIRTAILAVYYDAADRIWGTQISTMIIPTCLQVFMNLVDLEFAKMSQDAFRWSEVREPHPIDAIILLIRGGNVPEYY